MSDGDLAILRWLWRVQWATYAQVSEHFGRPASSLRRRFPRLEFADMIVCREVGPCRYKVWTITEAGAAVAGAEPAVAKDLSWATVAHTLGLTDLASFYERAGEVVITETEIRNRHDIGTIGASYAGSSVRPSGWVIGSTSRGGRRSHRPDLVLARGANGDSPGSGSVAIELELSRKSPQRLKEILAAYRHSTVYGQVIYFTSSRYIATAVSAAARATGTASMVSVRPWRPSPASGLVT